MADVVRVQVRGNHVGLEVTQTFFSELCKALEPRCIDFAHRDGPDNHRIITMNLNDLTTVLQAVPELNQKYRVAEMLPVHGPSAPYRA